MDSSSTTPQTLGLSNLPAVPQSRGPMQAPPVLPPHPPIQTLPPHVPQTLPSLAPQLGAPYTMVQSDCVPQAPIMTSVPLPTQTSHPPVTIQNAAPMLQSPITMTKVSLCNKGKGFWVALLVISALVSTFQSYINIPYWSLSIHFYCLNPHLSLY